MLDTDTLLAGTSISPLIMAVVQLIKGLTPERYRGFWAVNERQIVLVFLVGPLLLLGAEWIGYLPEWMTWRDAIRTGLSASLQASGLYSVAKATLLKKPRRT